MECAGMKWKKRNVSGFVTAVLTRLCFPIVRSLDLLSYPLMEPGFLVSGEDVRLLPLRFQLFVLRLQICRNNSRVLLVILRSTLLRVRSK